jgi:hypothetical protein
LNKYVYTLKIRLIHTGYTNLSNQVKGIHNDCPDITYKICMLHVLEKNKKFKRADQIWPEVYGTTLNSQLLNHIGGVMVDVLV